jgi:hypothetical protein
MAKSTARNEASFAKTYTGRSLRASTSLKPISRNKHNAAMHFQQASNRCPDMELRNTSTLRPTVSRSILSATELSRLYYLVLKYMVKIHDKTLLCMRAYSCYGSGTQVLGQLQGGLTRCTCGSMYQNHFCVIRCDFDK